MSNDFDEYWKEKEGMVDPGVVESLYWVDQLKDTKDR